MRQLLFLDVDGVLNSTEFYVSEARRRQRAAHLRSVQWFGRPTRLTVEWRIAIAASDLDPEACGLLREALDRLPRLEVVVSSSWRKGASLTHLRRIFRGVVPTRRLVGKTPSLDSGLRYQEIQTWLDVRGGGAYRFLALDDDTADMMPLGANFLHVPSLLGLTPGHVAQIVEHFRDPIRRVFLAP